MTMKTHSDLKESINASVIKTFSDMAFIDVSSLSGLSEKMVYSQILHMTFFEPVEGQIVLFLPSECKRLIVENIYGSDWNELHDPEIDDCLLEILNVLAGNFLTEYCGNDAKHDMSLPCLLFDEKEISLSEAPSEYYFDADGAIFKIAISFNQRNGEIES